MTRADAIRAAIGGAPVTLAYVLVALRRPSRRVFAGVVLGLAWNAPALLLVNLLALQVGWWSFAPELPEFMGVAVEPWLGWVVLWGAVAPLAAWDRPVAAATLAFVWLDLVAMPGLEPWVVLREPWPVGEAAAVSIALVPGMLLARWTIRGERLRWRATLQVVAAGGLMLWLIPSLALAGDGGWTSHLDRPYLLVTGQLLLVPIVLAIRAVIELAVEGRGTPVPYDPPRRLVRTGPYAYIANPMQTSIVLAYLGGGLVLGSSALVAAAAMAFAFGAGLAGWHEDLQLGERFGDEWTRYRGSVRKWIPRLRPSVPEPATLLVAFSCETCSSVGRWFTSRRPAGLVVAPAEGAAAGQRRVTYVSSTGARHSGVAGIARALEHVHLGWALAGWVLALPGVVQVAQAVADACAPGPQDVRGRPFDPDACSAPARSGRNG